MSVWCHVIISGVYNRFVPNLNVEHCSTEDMSCVVGFDNEIIVVNPRFIDIQGNNLLQTVIDVCTGKAFIVSHFPSNDLSVVFQENGTDSLCWVGHIDRSIVSTGLCKVWQCTTVVQMKV